MGRYCFFHGSSVVVVVLSSYKAEYSSETNIPYCLIRILSTERAVESTKSQATSGDGRNPSSSSRDEATLKTASFLIISRDS